MNLILTLDPFVGLIQYLYGLKFILPCMKSYLDTPLNNVKDMVGYRIIDFMVV